MSIYSIVSDRQSCRVQEWCLQLVAGEFSFNLLAHWRIHHLKVTGGNRFRQAFDVLQVIIRCDEMGGA